VQQIDNGIARVKDVIPRLSLLAQGGTAVGTVSLFDIQRGQVLICCAGSEHKEGLRRKNCSRDLQDYWFEVPDCT
jgi:hypothetical protein